MNFQITVALACLLDVRMSFIYNSSCICASNQGCSCIKLFFEYVKVLIQCRINSLADELTIRVYIFIRVLEDQVIRNIQPNLTVPTF